VIEQASRKLTGRGWADDVSVFEVLRKGLDDLSDLCDVVEEKFTTARDEFNATHPDRV